MPRTVKEAAIREAKFYIAVVFLAGVYFALNLMPAEGAGDPVAPTAASEVAK